MDWLIPAFDNISHDSHLGSKYFNEDEKKHERYADCELLLHENVSSWRRGCWRWCDRWRNILNIRVYTSYVGGVSSWCCCDRWYNILHLVMVWPLIQYSALNPPPRHLPPTADCRVKHFEEHFVAFLTAHVTLLDPLSSLLIWQNNTIAPISDFWISPRVSS